MINNISSNNNNKKINNRNMGPKSQHFVGLEVYVGEMTDRIDTWIAYGEFMNDGRPATMCFPFYSFDGRISECKWEMRHKNAPPLQVAMFNNPLNEVYFNLLDIDWPDYCFQFENADDWIPIAGIYIIYYYLLLSYLSFSRCGRNVSILGSRVK